MEIQCTIFSNAACHGNAGPWPNASRYQTVTLEPAADADVIKFINMNITNNAAALAGSHQLSHPAMASSAGKDTDSDSISCNSTREKKLTGVTVFALEFIAVVLLVSAVAIEVAIEETDHVRISRAQSLVLRERRDQLKHR